MASGEGTVIEDDMPSIAGKGRGHKRKAVEAPLPPFPQRKSQAQAAEPTEGSAEEDGGENDDEGLAEVEKILEVGINSGDDGDELFYEVKWKGYDASFNTW